MADITDKETRSRVMSRIRGRNTRPELLIRSGLHRLGYRFRLHDKKLPGRPDIVLPKYKALILVNGCFWHGHDCYLFRLPGTRRKFWEKKIGETRQRDDKNVSKYLKLGWRVLVVWECAIRGKSDQELSSVINECSYWLESKVKLKHLKANSIP